MVGKAVVAASRTARLATRNPSRLERQIADLKTLQETSGSLNARDEKQLEELERDLARVKKARTERPDLVPQRGDGSNRGGRGGGVLGKRDRDGRPRWGHDQSSSEETDEDVRKIPMPRDTPPPIPRQRPGPPRPNNRGERGNANMVPLGVGREHLQDRDTQTPDLSLPPKPVAVVQKVYESAPQVRDLRKEATQRFVPSVVKRKLDATKGKGRLLEEEEIEMLEREGYGGTVSSGTAGTPGTETREKRGPMVNAAPAVDDKMGAEQDDERLDAEQRRILEEEEERFAREMEMAEGDQDDIGDGLQKGVTMEEVEDL